MNHTTSASASSSFVGRPGATLDLRTIIDHLANDLEEFSQNPNCIHSSGADLPKLWMVTDVLRSMLTANLDTSTTRESFFLGLLDAADISGLEIEKDSQPHTFSSGKRKYLNPPPRPMPRVRADWNEVNGRTSSSRSPNNHYNDESRDVRPPIPKPPRIPIPREHKGMEVKYPDGKGYWTNLCVGWALESEIEQIQAQAAAEGVLVPDIPAPRWNGRERQFLVKVPWKPYGVWFNHSDEFGRKYRLQVKYYREKLAKYWKEYPPREGEFEDGAESERKRDDEKHVEGAVSELESAPTIIPKEGEILSELAPVLGKRTRSFAPDGDDNGDESHPGPSTPRPTKKLRSGPSLAVAIPPIVPCSPLSVSSLSPLTSLPPSPSRCPSPKSSPVHASTPIPIPASSPVHAPSATKRTKAKVATCARAVPRSSAPSQEPARRSTRSKAEKSS